MHALLRASRSIYRWTMLLYPFALRQEFGQEMAGTFEQQLRDGWHERGLSGIAQVWSCAIEEIFLVAVPARFDVGILRIGALSLLSTMAVFYFVLWGVTPPLHGK